MRLSQINLNHCESTWNEKSSKSKQVWSGEKKLKQIYWEPRSSLLSNVTTPIVWYAAPVWAKTIERPHQTCFQSALEAARRLIDRSVYSYREYTNWHSRSQSTGSMVSRGKAHPEGSDNGITFNGPSNRPFSLTLIEEYLLLARSITWTIWQRKWVTMQKEHTDWYQRLSLSLCVALVK